MFFPFFRRLFSPFCISALVAEFVMYATSYGICCFASLLILSVVLYYYMSVQLKNHVQIRSWNQPVLSNEEKVSWLRKQRWPLTEFRADRHPPITSNTS